MGLLTEGKPLSWEESKKFIEYVKKHGVEQFINIWNQCHLRTCDSFKWGDELEYLITYVPPNTHVCRLALRGREIEHSVNEELKTNESKMEEREQMVVHPEYGSFMIESTPAAPYGDKGCNLLFVEYNMSARRRWIERSLKEDEKLVAMTSFPMLGVGVHTHPYAPPMGPIAQSSFVPDIVINAHPRFGTLTQNIRLRRNKKVDIRVPLYRDKKTPVDEKDIHMDAMAFGMGCCCLQTTYQCRNVREARHLYDQLAVLGPVMMALSAATPFFRGKVSDWDLRWNIISQSVDDRTDSEKGLQPLKKGEQLIRKSRYGTIDSFMSSCDWLKEEYNDSPLEINKECYDRLKKAGIDELMARHVAHLFIRDPLVVYSDLIEMDDATSVHHFETIQSTNWHNVRFKPPSNTNTGWRVEFRPMEIQLTDFENAAYAIFVTLLSRAILFFGLNFYIPISKLDENMERAHNRSAVRNEKFHWRTCTKREGELEMAELSISDIFCGSKERGCLGLVTIVEDYIKLIRVDKETEERLSEYIALIKHRACGKLLTAAEYLRKFVKSHPLYKFDSNLNEHIARDIIDLTVGIAHGTVKAPELLGEGVDISLRRKDNRNTCDALNGCDNGQKGLLVSRL